MEVGKRTERFEKQEMNAWTQGKKVHQAILSQTDEYITLLYEYHQVSNYYVHCSLRNGKEHSALWSTTRSRVLSEKRNQCQLKT